MELQEFKKLKIGEQIEDGLGERYDVLLIEGDQLVVRGKHGLLIVTYGRDNFEKVKPFVIGKFGSRIREGDKVVGYPDLIGIVTKIELAKNRVRCECPDGAYSDFPAQNVALWSEAFIGKEELIKFGTLCYVDGEEFIADNHKEDIGATFAIYLYSVKCNSKRRGIIVGGEDIITMESYQKKQPKEYWIARYQDGKLMVSNTEPQTVWNAKNERIPLYEMSVFYIKLPSDLFPELTYENSPKRLKLE